MHTIAIVSRKGGAGKTTVAVHLAAAAEQAGRRAAILDVDPQASASAWSDRREADRPEVHVCLAQRLSRALEAVSYCDLVVIDTAPHAEGAALAAARAADIVLIPCRPAYFDLISIDAALDIARLAGTPALAVLNAIPPRGRSADQARKALTGWGLEVLAQTLGQRQDFVHALTLGLSAGEFQTRGKAAEEVRALYAALDARFNPLHLAETGS